jgi:aryl-alcohol dehydrogenase
VNTILVAGRTVRGIVEGDSVPQLFLPQLVQFWERGWFPVDRLMAHYDFDRIEEAVADAESGAVIKPVLRMS